MTGPHLTPEREAEIRAWLERDPRYFAARARDLLAALDAERDAHAQTRAALEVEITRVCDCDGEDHGGGPGVGVIDCERSPFDHGSNAYTGAGDVITDYFDCPCAPLRAALAEGGE